MDPIDRTDTKGMGAWRWLGRRGFLKAAAAVVTVAGFARAAFAAQSKRIYKAAVIGATGRGDYGHGFDVIFNGVPNVSVEAIADANPEGLKRAADRSGAKRSYSDYRQMLEKEKPDLVSIAPRIPEQHKDMALAAIDVGASIYIEKPITETVADADAIVSAAERKGVKIAVGHTRRITPDFVKVKRLLDEGFVGTVLDVRIQGKQDSRVGGEDLIVLGTHDFDLMRFYFGDPSWCVASVTQDGRRIRREDIRQGREPILVAGDTIRAGFAFPKNIHCTWNSVKTGDEWNRNSALQKWGFEIHGSKRIIAHQSGRGMFYLDSPLLPHTDHAVRWRDLPDPKEWPIAEHERHPIANLIYAIENDIEPLCSARDGRWTIEMVSAIYQSEWSGCRIGLPLEDRTHPLAR